MIVLVRIVRVIVVVRVVRMVVQMRNGSLGAMLDQPELRRRHARPEDALCRYVEVVNRQAPKRATECLEGQPGIEERAQDHVA